MIVKNIRRQHAVGQGFFNAGTILHEGRVRLRYVYDCGAMKKYSAALKNSVAAHLKDVGPRSRLDLLFISHMHADHVSGLPMLLDLKKGVSVDTIVLPFVDVTDRLIEFARCAIDEPASSKDGFYSEFITDPVSTLSRFKPRQILIVAPGRPSGPDGPSYEGGPDFRGPPIEGPSGIEPKDKLWKLAGTGAVDVESRDGLQIAYMTDQISLVAAPIYASSLSWLFSPYVDPAVAAKQKLFEADLLKSLNASLPVRARIAKKHFAAWLSNPANIRELVTNKVVDLVHAYEAVASDLNTTSMCLYSGPTPTENANAQHQVYFGKWHSHSAGDRIAWLSTGDADLKTGSRRAPFLRHFRKLLSRVATMTLPHHGSENNFHVELLTEVDPPYLTASADKFAKWRHPGSGVIQAIASHGRFLSVATSSQESGIVEVASLEN